MLTLCCCACRGAGDRAEAAAAPLTDPGAAAAGTLIRTPYYEIRVSLPEECLPPDPALGSAATRRVGVELTLEPTGDVQVPANPYYARLVDAEHDVYEATLGGCGTPLGPALPTRGQPARGWIVFELPRAARATTLLYAPELVGAPKSELAVDLRR